MRAGRCDSKEILLATRDHDHVDRKLILHHVGSRGSYYKLPIAASAFGRDIVTVLYDADADCIAQTQVWWNANMPCITLVEPYCLWSEDDDVEFHVNYDPFTSSIFELDDRFAAHYQRKKRMDYVLGEAKTTMEVRRLAARSLDSLVQEGKVPPP